MQTIESTFRVQLSIYLDYSRAVASEDELQNDDT